MTNGLKNVFATEADAILARELDRFALSHKLSERERDVFGLLLGQTVTNDEMAAKLGLSPNTISNHVKSILKKVDVAGKSELVVLFTRYLAARTAERDLFSRRPRVMVIDDELEFCELLKDDLMSRGVEVLALGDGRSALEAIYEFAPDVVVSDIRMPGLDGIELLKKLREQHPYHPRVILITGYSEYSKEQTHDEGAADLVSKPVDFEQLFIIVMEHFLARYPDQAEKLRGNKSKPANLGTIIAVSSSDIGSGGCFIPWLGGVQSGASQTLPKIDGVSSPTVGSIVEFNLQLPGKNQGFSVVAEVSWIRHNPQGPLRAGMGVRFVRMEPEAQQNLHEFVRSSHVRSFIPLGRAG